MSMLYKGTQQAVKNCFKCGKQIEGKIRRNDNAPTSEWWDAHICISQKRAITNEWWRY